VAEHKGAVAGVVGDRIAREVDQLQALEAAQVADGAQLGDVVVACAW